LEKGPPLGEVGRQAGRCSQLEGESQPGADVFIGGGGVDTALYGGAVTVPLTIDLGRTA
jgi:hypothetical protein